MSTIIARLFVWVGARSELEVKPWCERYENLVCGWRFNSA